MSAITTSAAAAACARRSCRIRQWDVHTQTIEGFWSTVKRDISGNYHSISAKWLQGYLNEFVWSYNRRYVVRKNGKPVIRTSDRAMFLSLVDRTVDTALSWS